MLYNVEASKRTRATIYFFIAEAFYDITRFACFREPRALSCNGATLDRIDGIFLKICSEIDLTKKEFVTLLKISAKCL